MNGAMIGDDDFAALFFHVEEVAADAGSRMASCPRRQVFSKHSRPWVFSISRPAEVHTAVLEVGMGGRLDATNIVEPMVSVITDISLDHMEWLGSPSSRSHVKKPASCATMASWSPCRSILKPTRH